MHINRICTLIFFSLFTSITSTIIQPSLDRDNINGNVNVNRYVYGEVITKEGHYCSENDKKGLCTCKRNKNPVCAGGITYSNHCTYRCAKKKALCNGSPSFPRAMEGECNPCGDRKCNQKCKAGERCVQRIVHCITTPCCPIWNCRGECDDKPCGASCNSASISNMKGICDMKGNCVGERKPSCGKQGYCKHPAKNVDHLYKDGDTFTYCCNYCHCTMCNSNGKCGGTRCTRSFLGCPCSSCKKEECDGYMNNCYWNNKQGCISKTKDECDDKPCGASCNYTSISNMKGICDMKGNCVKGICDMKGNCVILRKPSCGKEGYCKHPDKNIYRLYKDGDSFNWCCNSCRCECNSNGKCGLQCTKERCRCGSCKKEEFDGYMNNCYWNNKQGCISKTTE